MGWRGVCVVGSGEGVTQPMCSVSLSRIIHWIPPYDKYILIKIEKNRDEDADLRFSSVCYVVLCCFMVDDVGMEAIVQEKEALTVWRLQYNAGTEPLH
jgi:hypothetical protein